MGPVGEQGNLHQAVAQLDPSTRPAETMSRPDAGSLISRSAARNASVDDVAISLLHLFWSIEGRHLMCPEQIWRMTSGAPMVRRPAGVPKLKMPWNNNGPSPWGNPGGNQGGGNQGGGASGGGGGSGGGGSGGSGQGGGQGGGGDGDGPPPHGPWGGGGGDSGGGGGRRGGPFGGGPFGPNGPVPDIEGLIRQAQAFVRNLLPGGRGVGAGGLTILVAVVVALWFASGFYRVQPDEQGIVLRFGAYKYWTPPGLHWHIPWPVETVERPAVTRINRTEIGFRSGANGPIQGGTDNSGRDVLAESLMLTGDENIIDIDFVVFWRIRPNDASKFLFNARRPSDLVFGVAESSMREVIGRTPIQPALTQLRAQIESDVMHQTQEILDRYNVGIEVDSGAAAKGRSSGRRGRKLPRCATRQHRRRAHAQRGRVVS